MLEREIAALEYCFIRSFPFQRHDVSGIDLEAIDNRHHNKPQDEHENGKTAMHASGNRYLEDNQPIHGRR